MRKLIFLTVVVLGALVGLFATIRQDWATRTGMMLVGVVVALPFAGLAFVGRRQRSESISKSRRYKSKLTGNSVSPDDLVANYWRDEGHPPFMKPSDTTSDVKPFRDGKY